MSGWIEGINALSAIWAEAMTRVLWQGGLALLAVALVCRLAPRIPAYLQCWLWRLAFVKLFVAMLGFAPVELPLLPPGASAPPSPSAPVLFPTYATPLAASPASSSGEIPLSVTALAPRMGLLGWIALFWLAVLCGWAVRVRRQYCETRRIRNSAVPIAEPAVLSQARELSIRLGLSSTPEVLVTGATRGPFLAGVLRPAVILPQSLVAAGDLEELRLVLAHELGHLKRRDLPWTWLPTLAQGLFPFHPLVWWAQREWSVAVETACDELVLRETAAPPARYARMLLDTATRFGGDTQLRLTTVGVVGSCRSLRRRLQMMHYVRPLSRRHQRLMTATLVAVGAVTVVPWRVVAAPAAPVEAIPAPPIAPTVAAPLPPAAPVVARGRKRAHPARAARPVPQVPGVPAPPRIAPEGAVSSANPRVLPASAPAVPPAPLAPGFATIRSAPAPAAELPASPPAPERARKRKARPTVPVEAADPAPALAPARPAEPSLLAVPAPAPEATNPATPPAPVPAEPGIPILKDLPLLGRLFRNKPAAPTTDPALPLAATGRPEPAEPRAARDARALPAPNPYAGDPATRQPQAAADSVIEVFALRHIYVTDLQHLLQTGSGLPRGIGRLVPDTRANSLVIQGSEPGLKNLKAAIRLLDVPMKVERGRFRITISPANVKAEDLRLHLLELPGAQEAEVKLEAEAKSLTLEGSNLWLRQAMALAARLEMGLGPDPKARLLWKNPFNPAAEYGDKVGRIQPFRDFFPGEKGPFDRPKQFQKSDLAPGTDYKSLLNRYNKFKSGKDLVPSLKKRKGAGAPGPEPAQPPQERDPDGASPESLDLLAKPAAPGK